MFHLCLDGRFSIFVQLDTCFCLVLVVHSALTRLCPCTEVPPPENEDTIGRGRYTLPHIKHQMSLEKRTTKTKSLYLICIYFLNH